MSNPLMVPLLFFIALLAGSLYLLNHLRRRLKDAREANLDLREQHHAIFSFLDKIGARITSDMDVEGTLETISEYITEATDAEAGAIFILDKERKHLTAKCVVGVFPPINAKIDYVVSRPKHLKALLTHTKIHLGEGLIGKVAFDGQPVLIEDATTDPRAPQIAQNIVPVHSLILSPLKIRDRVLGVCAVANKRSEPAFDEMDLTLLVTLSDLAAVTVDMFSMHSEMAEKRQMEQDLRIAREFQDVLLPRETPRIDGFEFAAHSQAAREIGGDYYDFIPIDDNRLGVVIADVSGKGIPGALVMSMVRASLRIMIQRGLTPREILRALNRRLIDDTRDNVFVTMTYGVLDIKRRVFRFARSGHEPTISYMPGEKALHLHTPEGIALGLVDGELYDTIDEMEIQMTPGTLIMLYTDGVVEAMNGQNKEYGQDRLVHFIETHQGSARELIEGVTSDIADFTRGLPQYDDLTMVCLRAPEAPTQSQRQFTADKKRQSAM